MYAGGNSVLSLTTSGATINGAIPVGANTGVGAPPNPTDTIFGGGGGSVANSTICGTSGGSSIYGGGGGGSGDTAFGKSVFGGNGGYGLSSVTLQSPTTPGGGGGQGISQGNTSGQAGARGEVRVWVVG